MKKKRLLGKVLMGAAMLGVVAYFGVNIAGYFEDPLTTTLAYTYPVSQGVDVTGYVVRDEVLLPDEDAGVLHLTRAEGEKVSRNGTVATVYADSASLQAQTEADALAERIEQLRYARDAAMADEVALKLDSQISTALLDYREEVSAGQLRDAETAGSKLRSLILKRDYTHADTENLETQILSLQAELDAKKAQVSASVRKVTTSISGLWSAAVDGYERVLTPESVLAMTPSELSSLTADSAVSSNTGKMILGDKWYFAAVLSEADAKNLNKQEARGVSLSLRFTKEAERDLPVTIAHVSEAENGRCVVVLEGEQYLQELTMLRKPRAQIVTGTVEGLRIPKEALHAEKTSSTSDGTAKTDTVGVYCVVGMEARFKPVEVIYSGETYVIVRSTAGADQENIRIRPGDEVIVQARGLYDGKVVG